jgi:hypothetical protein
VTPLEQALALSLQRQIDAAPERLDLVAALGRAKVEAGLQVARK